MSLFLKICLAFLAILLVCCHAKKSTNRVRLFHATYDAGVGGCSLVFYKDSTCTWIGGIGSDDKEGTYRIQGAVITLKGIPIENCLKSNKLLMTTISPNNISLNDTILVQVDSNLKVVDRIHIFTVL
jgi:hypothetical protein